ncbi:hypothetical protein [Paenibacillus xerothermodurans]|uniref:hypothetical protein n=1 Tax=Paenibacillus xerothermodurans TaxID=1977292 RepID=UPI001402F886|nr:hypothetical protein [Paenibacillus xerothermodurans]
MLKKPVDMSEWRKIHQCICWFAESGIHVSSDMVQAIEDRFLFAVFPDFQL